MNQLDYLNLEKYYEIMYKNMISNKILKNDSILISFLKTTSTNVNKILRLSQIDVSIISMQNNSTLVKEGYLQNFEEYDKYIISIKGIWEIETKKGVINENILLEYLSQQFYKNNPNDDILTDKEKVILFSMILGRTFSINYSVNLLKSEVTTNKWLEILIISYGKLSELNIISQSKEDILSSSKYTNIVSSIFRHNNNMSIKIKGIYNYSRNNTYYLDLYDKNLNEEKLSYLFYKIFEKKIDMNKIFGISNLCNKISKDYSIFLYDSDTILFSRPEFDLKIKDSLMNSLLII